MPKIMLIDAAQPEETRVAVMDGRRLDNFDIESASKKQLKGNIYLAKVTRVEPSLQAAFVNYGGNRHGFLPFSEIHPDYYRIPVEDRERLLAEQEELSRQLMEEAKAREEREMAEAEARAANPEMDAEADAADMPEGEDDFAAEADVIEPQDAAPEAFEDEGDAEGEDDLMDGEEEAEGADDMDADAEGGDEAVAEGDAMPAEGGDEQAVTTEGAEGQQDGNRRRGRNNRRRRGRDRNRGGRGRGLERKQDQLVDRDGHSDEEDTGMTSLWKRMRRSYKIQEVIKRGQIMLIQVVKEERGNKGAAVTTYITMPGRYCVLMPNSPQSGGVSRKVASHAERRKMREMLDELQVPQGMSVILRTAGVDRTPDEVKRDLDYLMRLWDRVRDTTMQSTAPSLIHEEGSLVKRAVRDLFSKDIKEVVVEGPEGAKVAAEMMSVMMPEYENAVREYKDTVPLFIKYGAEPQIDAIHSNTVTLPSGGYLVINPTEALVSIDINSGRATRERHIEETALKTNIEAADEIARQLRLRDLGGLVVIDFIDMESRRHNAMVERRMRDALSTDRARVQVGRISSFGLMELSRQRLRPSLTETHFQTCPHCRGLGMMRTTEAMALAALRAIETVGMEGRAGEVTVTVTEGVAMFLFNAKRATLAMLEKRYDLQVVIRIASVVDNDQGFLMEVSRSRRAERVGAIDAVVDGDLAEDDVDDTQVDEGMDAEERQPDSNASDFDAQFGRNNGGRREGGRDGNRERGGRRRGRRGGRNRFRDRDGQQGGDDFNNGNVIPQDSDMDVDDNIGNRKEDDGEGFAEGNGEQPHGESREGGREGGRRRGRRGGRNRGGNREGGREGGRDGNREGGRERGGRERNNENFGNEAGDQQPRQAPAAASIQTVYQTPTRKAAPEADGNSMGQPAAYEVNTEAKGEKKKGWWKKLTG
ncbi:MAG: Rne/Rng family ribonuclease [Alphaproteobacteria bacterium]|nr:Rne/Rng family ribonuclease [Alphaproteobacteria bacterium]